MSTKYALLLRKNRYGGIRIERENIAEDPYYFHSFGKKEIGGKEYDNVVVYCGKSHGKHYYESKDLEEVPEYILDRLAEENVTLVKDVDAGWDNWGGRPEFSEAFHDFTEAKIVLQ